MLLKKRIRVIPELLMYDYKGIRFSSRSFRHLTRTYIYGLNFGYLIIVGRRIVFLLDSGSFHILNLIVCY